LEKAEENSDEEDGSESWRRLVILLESLSENGVIDNWDMLHDVRRIRDAWLNTADGFW
jgi:hypothetical protein